MCNLVSLMMCAERWKTVAFNYCIGALLLQKTCPPPTTLIQVHHLGMDVLIYYVIAFVMWLFLRILRYFRDTLPYP